MYSQCQGDRDRKILGDSLANQPSPDDVVQESEGPSPKQKDRQLLRNEVELYIDVHICVAL